MNYATIKPYDIANGPGVRVSLFVSGCPHHCPGCFNQETWDFAYGQPYGKETEEAVLSALAPSYIKGFSLLGGEPFAPENQAELLPLVKAVRRTYPQKTIWAYSGYLWEQLLERDGTDGLLPYLDVLVDGRFLEGQKDLNLRFRGSANQRILDVPASLQQGCAVPWTDPRDKR